MNAIGQNVEMVMIWVVFNLMEIFLRIDNNIIAAVLLGIVVLIACKRLDRNDRLNRVYLKTSAFVLCELLLETVTCIMNQRPEAWAGSLSTVLHVFLFALAPILTYFWYLLITNWSAPEKRINNKIQALLIIPVIFNFIITVLSPVYQLVFYIDGTNTYHRGPLFLISVFIVYFYLMLAFVLVCIRRRKIVREEYIPMMISEFCR